jgi:UDP-N-acetylmuramate--alanine ligase
VRRFAKQKKKKERAMRAIKRIHFVGVGGSGMCGLAEIMHNLGYRVSGSDIADAPPLARLRALGIKKITVGHNPANADAADAVVYSAAIAANNPELARARLRGVPLVSRAQMLGELLRFKQGIAVAGTHGKTTITSMITAALGGAGMDPTCVIGGRLSPGGGNAKLGAGEYIVVEADESDATFLHLRPIAAVVSNIDDDHLAAYGGDAGALSRAFVDFLENLPFYGFAAICFDDSRARALAAQIPARVISYGIHKRGADYGARAIRLDSGIRRFTLTIKGRSRGEWTLRVAGVHNVQNALAAIAIADELGASLAKVKSALAEYAGVGRRLESHGERRVGGGKTRALLIDDYAHHPTEIKAVFAALREAYPHRRLLAVFEPHRYTRTRDTFEALAGALASADALALLPVYAAGEAPIVKADSQTLARAIRLKGKVEPVFVEDAARAPAQIQALARDGDLIVTLGAGGIAALARRLTDEWPPAKAAVADKEKSVIKKNRAAHKPAKRKKEAKK